MCVGIPSRIMACDGIVGRAEDGALVDLSLTGPVAPGTWVLTFLGAARSEITAHEAAQIGAALDALRSVMGGGDAGQAFDDIDAGGPRLPTHLQAALDAGLATG